MNWVEPATRSISATRAVISVAMEVRSSAELVSFAACTASSRMRCRLSLIWFSAPSVVCTSEMPSLALR
ncbi:hypothetical protein D3C78_1577910 [compost metagenome]